MINIKLPRRVNGDKLADTVESAMRELPEFNFEREPIQEYNSNSELVEVERSLKARKKLKWYDPLIVASSCGGGLGVLTYFIPVIGQALYVGVLLIPDMRRCVIKTKIDLRKEYEALNFEIGRGVYIDITCESINYKDVRKDVEEFISNLNKRLLE